MGNARTEFSNPSFHSRLILIQNMKLNVYKDIPRLCILRRYLMASLMTGLGLYMYIFSFISL